VISPKDGAVSFQKAVHSLSTIVMIVTFIVNAADTGNVQPCQKPISYENTFVP
jgi:hypothetical protein